MGAYLRKPVTTKLSEDGYLSVGGEECQYTVTAMRGWRITMEVSNVFKSENDNYLCHDYVQKNKYNFVCIYIEYDGDIIPLMW